MNILAQSLLGLQKLLAGAQTDPAGTAQKLANSPVSPEAIEMAVNELLGPQLHSNALAGPPLPPAIPDAFLLGEIIVRAQRPSPEPPGIKLRLSDTLTPLPEQKPAQKPEQKPEVKLTPEQIAKLQSLMPANTMQAKFMPPVDMPGSKPVQINQLALPQKRPALSLADILRGGR